MLTVKVVGTAYEVEYGRVSIRVQSKERAAELVTKAIMSNAIVPERSAPERVVQSTKTRSNPYLAKARPVGFEPT